MEIIPKFYLPSSKEEGGIFISASDVFKKINEGNLYLNLKSNIQAIGRAMKSLGFNKETKYNEEKNILKKDIMQKKCRDIFIT